MILPLDSNIYLRVIVQVVVWNILPFVLAALLPAKFNDVQDELSVGLRRQDRNRSKAGAYFTGLSFATGAFVLGLANIYIARVVGLTAIDWATGDPSALVLMVLGACVSLTGVTYAGWYYGTRIAWTTQNRPTPRPTRNLSLESDEDDSPESERLNVREE